MKLNEGIALESIRSGDEAINAEEPISSTPPFHVHVARYLFAGLLGGGLLYLVELGDRLVVLGPSFLTAFETLLFAVYLLPVIPVAVLVALALGAASSSIRSAFSLARRKLGDQMTGRSRSLVATLIVAALILACFNAAWMFSSLEFRANVKFFLLRLPQSFFPSVDLASYTRTFFLLITGIPTIGLLVTDALLGMRTTRWTRVRSAILCIGAIGIQIIFYYFNSRFEIGRHTGTIHLYSVLVQTLLAIFAGGLFVVALGSAQQRSFLRSRPAMLLLGITIAGSAFSFWHIGRNENLKALLWHRSSITRFIYQGVNAMTDRDGDGFSSLLGGADLDDADTTINSYASEVPGNGLDDNCFGGDAPADVQRFRSGAPVAAQHSIRARNFILIAIDTLRADRMGCYGYQRPTTPRIDEHARRGRLFRYAYSQATNTGPAFASMQRSATREAVFDWSRPSLFGRLAESGRVTGQLNAFPHSGWLKDWLPYRDLLLDGIQVFPNEVGEWAAIWDDAVVTDKTIAYLAALPADQPHATWVHYFEPHAPRRKMAPFDFGDTLSDMYDSEVAYTDREVGRLLDWLNESGRMQDTVVVLMSDHGEAFGEHDGDQHGNRPYDDQLRVPLIVWAPGLTPAVVERQACTVDIAPTVLNCLDLAPIPGAEGQDLLAHEIESRPVYSEVDINFAGRSFFSYSSFYSCAVTDGGWRLIYDLRRNTYELYDLKNDPQELRNVFDVEPDRAKYMVTLLARWLDSTRFAQLPPELMKIPF